MSLGSLPLAAAAASFRTGPGHEICEDRHRILDGRHPLVTARARGCLYAVADGVSSARRGREAAETTCARLDGFFDASTPASLDALVQLVTEIDWELRDQGDAACTLSLLWIASGHAHVVHVGDSEVYRVRHGEVSRVTAPQGGAGRGLRAYVGMGPRIAEAIQVWSAPLFVGDLFLLVSDGVTEVVSSDELLDAWWTFGGSPARAARAIIDAVGRRNGRDDATALVVDVLALETASDDESTHDGRTDFLRNAP
jgi:serine/threonine protein phosphatase PrpC